MADGDKDKGSPSAVSKRHIAETKKFEAETEFLKAEQRRAWYEGENERIEYEDGAHFQEYNRAADHRNRTFSMVGVIDDDTIEDLVDKVNAWARISANPIIIRLNSPGGDVHAGLALYDQLKSVDMVKAPIHTVAMGMTASMAGIIFQAGRRRIISHSATFLIHEVSVHGLMGVSRSELDDISKSVDRLNTRLYKILAERSSLSLAEISKNAERKDWEIDAEEAIKYGFADEIGYV